jgi:hypothetical protein
MARTSPLGRVSFFADERVPSPQETLARALARASGWQVLLEDPSEGFF